MEPITVLFFADVCSERATAALCRALPHLRARYQADLIVVNAENSCDSNGTMPGLCEELFFAGADVLSGGNHTLKNPEMADYLDNHPRALRPRNLATQSGAGQVIVDVRGVRVLVANFMGQAYLSTPQNPFVCADELFEETAGKWDVALCDLHAEATAEKGAFFHAFKDRFSVVVGTHTHVPTDDLQVKDGCGFITDLGMCAPAESVLGVRVEESIRRFRTGEPLRYRPASGKIVLMGACFRLGTDGRCISAERIRETVE